MKTKMSCISCILALIITATVWAEDIRDTAKSPESPQNTATAGLTTAEADQFMSTTEWGEVKFDKAFIYAGFEQGKTSTLDLGAAFKAGPVYIGSWYQGNLGSYGRTKENSVTTTIKQSTAGLLGDKKTEFNSKLYKNYTADHTAVVLVGFGSMGIKLGYKRAGENKSGKYDIDSLRLNQLPDSSDVPPPPHADGKKEDSRIKHSIAGGIKDTVYSPKGYDNRANHLPFVEFGMNVGLGRMTLSPTAGLEVYVHQDSSYGFKTVTQKASDVNYTITKTGKGSNYSHVGIIGKLGVGLALGDALNSSFTFGYELTANAYGKTYKDASGKVHKVRGYYKIDTDISSDKYNDMDSGKRVRTDTFKADFTTKSLYKNKLNVEYAMQKDFTDRFSLFAGVACPITVTAEKSVVTTVDEETTVTTFLNPAKNYDNKTVKRVTTHPETTTNIVKLNIDPVIKAAVSYAAVPNRLFLNLGTEVKVLRGEYTNTKKTVNSFVNKTVETTTTANGSVKKGTSAKVENASGDKEFVMHDSKLNAVEAELKGGLRWNVVDNFAFDLVYTQLLSKKIINLTQFGDIKLACTIKF